MQVPFFRPELEALGLEPGQGVLVPTMTFAATAEIVRYLGAIPVLVDCDPVTANLSFYANKPITTGEGGMAVRNDSGLADDARRAHAGSEEPAQPDVTACRAAGKFRYA